MAVNVARAGTSPRVSTKHPAEDERGSFEELAERASNFTSSPAFFGGCALLVALWAASFAVGNTAHHVAGDLMAAVTLLLLEQRKGNETAAQDELAQAIGLHDEV
jgi:hypothetical protein